MRRLLESPQPNHLRWITLVALPFTVGFFLFFRVHDRPLAPYTIVDFELAWTPARVEQLFSAWGAAGQQAARESLYIDFGFMPAYALFFAGATLLVARAAAGRVQTLGLWLSLAPFVAAVLDAIENLALLRVLDTAASPSPSALALAGVCASVKFLLLLLCLLYWLGTLAVSLLPKRSA